MEAELQSLEERIKLLAKQYQQLRNENIELRQTVLGLQNDNKRLGEKVDAARLRVEALIAQLPEEEPLEDAV
jgi:uncharacterized protein (TIGR02449 family)